MNTGPGKVHCYAVRRLNPFMGVLQVIETTMGRAISANGIVWDIEVMAQPPLERKGDRGRGAGEQTTRQAYYRYGLWSETDGLVNRPLAPHLQSDPLTQHSDLIIQKIKQQLSHLPFPLADTIELWLFDAEARLPLVLLDAITEGQAIPSPEPRRWTACMGAEGVPSQRRFPEVRALEEQVKKRAGFNQQRIWVRRLADGRGEALQSGEAFESAIFPPYLIQQSWPEEPQVQRVSEYIQWIAPSLLTLQHLSQTQREMLEENLYVQAVSIEHHWHLYPQVLNEAHLKAARVQCQLQLSQKENN